MYPHPNEKAAPQIDQHRKHLAKQFPLQQVVHLNEKLVVEFAWVIASMEVTLHVVYFRLLKPIETNESLKKPLYPVVPAVVLVHIVDNQDDQGRLVHQSRLHSSSTLSANQHEDVIKLPQNAKFQPKFPAVLLVGSVRGHNGTRLFHKEPK